MPIIFLIIFLAAIMYAAHWLDLHPGIIQIFLFAGYIWLAFFIYRKFQRSNWLYRYNLNIKQENSARQQREEQERRQSEADAQAEVVPVCETGG
jgi:hypothetical protein